MKRASLVVASLLATACTAFRPSPPETVPDAYRPDGTPVRQEAPPPPIRRVERPEDDAPKVARFHLAVFAGVQSANLYAAEGAFPLPEMTPTMGSLDVTLMERRGFGLGGGFRVIRGSGKVPEYLEGVAILGTPRMAVDFGLATRNGPHIFRGGAYDSLYAVMRLGGRSRINVGTTPLSLSLRGARYIPLPAPGTDEWDTKGWNAEAGVTWTFDPVPWSINLGYRYDRLEVRDRRQKASGFTIGTGFLFGRR